MKRSLFILFAGVLLLGLPALSHATFENFSTVASGTAPRISAGFTTVNSVTGQFETTTLSTSPAVSAANITVEAARPLRTLKNVPAPPSVLLSVLDDGAISFDSASMLTKDNAYMGNVNLHLEFYTGTVESDLSGTGRRYSLDAGAEAFVLIKNSSSWNLVIKTIGVTRASYDEIIGGDIIAADQPAVVGKVKFPFMELE